MEETVQAQRAKQEKLRDRKFKCLNKRIRDQFNKKKFLGDIAITDEEYAILLSHARMKFRSMDRAGRPLFDDMMLSIALVQIGIRTYDKRFWPHVEEAFSAHMNQRQRQLLADTFSNTMKVHDKYRLGEEGSSGCVKTILFHGFVSNYYSKGLFELLFQYYSKDLERNINRNTPEQMQALMDTLAKKAEEDKASRNDFINQFMETGSRAYMLKHHTLEAIRVYPTHSRVRLRRLLRMIDQAFWNGVVPKNPTSRLSILFKEWVKESQTFNYEYRLCQQREIRNRGKKHFSTPYLFAHIGSEQFEIKLPAQIIPQCYAEGLAWKITTVMRSLYVYVDTYPALTGYKTEEAKCEISVQELFGRIRCELMWEGTQVRRFSDLMESRVRFFDMEGDYALHLFKIPMCAYTCGDDKLKSSALMDQTTYGDLTRWDFEFQKGDLVVLPDGSGMVVGDAYEDGYIPRGCVEYTSCITDSGQKIPVYATPPELLLTIPESKLNGTLLVVDHRQYRLIECEMIAFEEKDARGVKAVLLPLGQFPSCQEGGHHKVLLDVPGKNVAMEFPYAYIKGMNVQFDGAPYIFADRGTLLFPENIQVESEYERIGGENGFQFEMNGESSYIPVQINHQLSVQVEVPVFMWSTDRAHWNVAPAGELWHTEFFKIKKLYMKSPNHKISFYTNTDAPDDEDIERRVISAEPCQDGMFVVDMTRFRSWLTRDHLKNDVFVKIGKEEFLFATVYTRSLARTCEVQADYEQEVLNCFCDIIGKAEYYLDVVHVESGKMLAEKKLLQNGRAEIHDVLSSGKYRFIVYEAEDDESGFDDLAYEEIYCAEQELINSNDFSGCFLEVRQFKSKVNSNMYTRFKQEYLVVNLEKIGMRLYVGKLLCNREETEFKVQVHFMNPADLRFVDLSFWHEDEEIYVPFLYDSLRKILVKDEASGLRPSERYRRYSMLDDEKYLYFTVLSREMPPYVQDEEKIGTEYFLPVDYI